MKSLRENPPKEIGGYDIVRFIDYKAGRIVDTAAGTETSTGMESSDVLSFVTNAGDTIVIRPSGTEPKIKIYFLVSGETAQASAAKLAAYKETALAWTKE